MFALNSSLDNATIAAVWNKGEVMPNNDPAIWRRDVFGTVIRRDQHGQRDILPAS